MTEGCDIEIGIQLAVDPREQILVEFRRDSLVIVVGGMQERRCLLEVDTDEQPAVWTEKLGDSPKQIARLGGVEIADARTGEEDCPLLHIEEAGKFERFRIIGTDTMDLPFSMILGDSACRHAESFTRNIDRCVGLGLYRFQQHTNFGATPAPKF